MVARLKGRPTPPPGPSQEENQSSSTVRKKRSPFLVTITVLSLIIALASSATLIYLTYFAGGNTGHTPSTETVQAQSTGPIYNLGPFVMNLGNIDEHRYLRVALSLDFQTRDSGYVGQSASKQESWLEHTREALKSHEPILKDLVLTTLASRSVQSIGTAMAREELKADLMASFNQHMPENLAVQQIYFTDFVIQ